MTPKMVAKFRRSLSFPNNISSSSKPKKTLHVRSTSLPACRSHHPVISLLKDQIHDLKSSNLQSPVSLLTRLKIVHESLEDLLHLPQTRDSLFRNPYHDTLLEDFLRFLDVYRTFQTLLLSLKQQISSAQVAIRSRNVKSEDSNFKNLKKIAKQISGLVSNLRLAGATAPDGSSELTDIIRDVEEVTVMVSIAVFNGVKGHFLPEKKGRVLGLRLNKRVKIDDDDDDDDHDDEKGIMRILLENGLRGLRKKGEEHVKMALKRMHELEDWIDEVEIFTGRIYRSLINTRVSLLNVLTS